MIKKLRDFIETKITGAIVIRATPTVFLEKMDEIKFFVNNDDRMYFMQQIGLFVEKDKEKKFRYVINLNEGVVGIPNSIR